MLHHPAAACPALLLPPARPCCCCLPSPAPARAAQASPPCAPVAPCAPLLLPAQRRLAPHAPLLLPAQRRLAARECSCALLASGKGAAQAQAPDPKAAARTHSPHSSRDTCRGIRAPPGETAAPRMGARMRTICIPHPRTHLGGARGTHTRPTCVHAQLLPTRQRHVRRVPLAAAAGACHIPAPG